MLSLSSLAFILASARRRARALSCAAFHRFPDIISGRKMATKIATKMLTEMLTKMAVASMSVPHEQLIPSWLGRDIRRFPVQKYNQRRFWTLPCPL
jgi:hypothetical protein